MPLCYILYLRPNPRAQRCHGARCLSRQMPKSFPETVPTNSNKCAAAGESDGAMEGRVPGMRS